MNASTKLVCMCVWICVCMYVCMHVCSTALCLLVRCPSRVCAYPPAVHHRAYLLSQGNISCMDGCSTRCMYVSAAICLFMRCLPFAHARMFTRRRTSRLLHIAGIYFVQIRVLIARYVRCRRVPHSRAMSAHYSCSHPRPTFMNGRSPVGRCSLWFHPCLYVVKGLHASRPPNNYLSLSHTDVHVCSTPVGIICMPPSCSAWSCPLWVADHPLTPDLCPPGSVVAAFL